MVAADDGGRRATQGWTVSHLPSAPGVVVSPRARLTFGALAASDPEDLASLPVRGTGGAKAVSDRCSPAREAETCAVRASSGDLLVPMP